MAVAAVLLLRVESAALAFVDAGLTVAEMDALEGRIATIGHRLAVANLELCADRQWRAGLAVHDLSQYAPSAREEVARTSALGAGPAILAVAAEGPAVRAGLRPGDVLRRFDDVALDPTPPDAPQSHEQVERILDRLEGALEDGAARIGIDRGGEPLEVELAGEQGCATRFQLVVSDGLRARADGRYVQLSSGIAVFAQSEDELAAVIAHELAHNILRHKARLDEAEVARGFLGNFGRNARLIRETEEEADRLSVYLLANAGYDPQAAIALWTRLGRHGLNFLSAPTHPNWRRRTDMLREELARIARQRAAGEAIRPPFLAAAPSGD